MNAPGSVQTDRPAAAMSPTRARALATARQIVSTGLAGHAARMFLFGSSARGDAVPRSDIDGAVLPLQTLPPLVLATIAAALDEGLIPYTVDLIDLSEAGDGLRSKILREGVEWPIQ